MEYITSGKAGKLLGVDTVTVNKFYDLGLLDGYHLPISNHLRVTSESVLRVIESRQRVSSTVTTISAAS